MITRHVNSDTDTEPSHHHIFNFQMAKKYISNKQVLDIGCWSGQFEKLAQPICKKIYGIDPDSDAIRYAKKNVPSAIFKVGSALNLPFRRNIFDSVVFVEVIEHVPKNTELQVLKEISRVLKVNGHLILSTPTNNIFSILLDPAYFTMGHRHYSFRQLERLLNSSGFQILKTYYTSGFVRLLAYDLQIVFKLILKRYFKNPEWVNRAIQREYEKGGFAQIHIIAQKTS